MNTVNSFQYHRLSFQYYRLRKRGKLGYNDDEDRDRHVTTAPPPQTVFSEREKGNGLQQVRGRVGGSGRHVETCHL